MKRRKRLLAGLLCVILSVTAVLPTGLQVSAEQLWQDGQPLITEETAETQESGSGTGDSLPETLESGPDTEDRGLEKPETQTETGTESNESETFGTESVTEETETEVETETETQEAETIEDESMSMETPEMISAVIMPIPLEQTEEEHSNTLLPFEIGGTDIYAGLGNASLYSTSRVNVAAAKYDPRTEAPEEMTAVRNQNPYGTCWAFAMMATLENSMVRQGFADNTIDLSERHLAYFSRNSGSDKLGNASDDIITSSPYNTYLKVGGNAYLAAVRLMNWQGAAAEADYPYSGVMTPIDASLAQDAEVLAHDVYFVPTSNASKEEKMDAVKKLIAEYGAVQWSYGDKTSCYNETNHAYYNPVTGTNHAITVVGWDDDYPAENFGNTRSETVYRPSSNGAWIVKNSWGADWGENGYFYISYEDKSLGSGNPASVSVAAKADTYDNNYFYGNTAYCTTSFRSYNKVSQVYQVQGAGEQLEAISCMLYSDKTDYSIQIYRNPELIDGVVENPESGEAMLEAPVTGTTGYSGFYTIDLPEPVALAQDDHASIVIDFTAHGDTGKNYAFLYTDSTAADLSVGSSYSVLNENKTQAGQSFYYAWDSDEKQYRWFDAHDDGFNFRINALTVDSELVLSETELELAKNRVRKLKVVQQPALETGAAGTVSFTTSNADIVTVSEEGVLTGISAGNAVITAKSKDRNGKVEMAVCKVTVNDTEDIAGGIYEDLIWFIDANGKLTVEGTGDFAPPDSGEGDAEAIGKRRAPWYCDPENIQNRWCEQITSAEIKVAGMTDASYMFYDCRNLTDVDFDEFDTGQVTNMTRMFDSCYGLEKLDLSGFDTSNVTAMSGMFADCWKLTNLDLSNFDTKNVTGMTWMFYGCKQLVTVDLSSFDMGKTVTEKQEGSRTEKLEDMFKECPKLSVIYTPTNLPHSILLPDDGGSTWYQPEGEWCQSGETVITELPKNLSYSILIAKNEKPVVAYLTVQKAKTDCECGEALAVDDLTVTYVNSRGLPKKLTQADYITNAEEIDLSTPGAKTLIITHVDEETGKEATAEIELTAVYILQEGSLTIRLSDEYPNGVIYDGTPKTPALEVKTSLAGIVLTEGQDYTAVYENNIDAGTATVTLTGQNDYQGTDSFSFTIQKAAAPEAEEAEVCFPCGKEQKEQTLAIAERFAKYGEITGYRVSYTENTDADRHIFSEAPYITEGILFYRMNAGTESDSAAIIVEISFANYENTVVVLDVKFIDERLIYTVTFDMSGHGAAILPVTVSGKAGLIGEPEQPEADGYRFMGWYQDRDCTTVWDFNTDTVEDDMTLYAGWLVAPKSVNIAGELYIQEIQNQIYTGSPIRPALQVYATVGDGKDRVLLKQGKDYSIKYYNNTDVDLAEEEGGISATGEEGDNGFTKSLPYVVITGKGNYQGTMYRNFHIDPAAIADKGSADTDEPDDTTLAKGFTLKYKDQLTSAQKAQKPFTSIKYKKSMKLGRDYTLQLSVLTAYDSEGNALGEGTVLGTAGSTLKDTVVPAIPAGAKGTFLLTITGKGNYSGTVKKTVSVSDKNHLMKNASVTLGKDQKKMEYAGDNISLILTPAYYDASAKKYYGFKENVGGSVMDTETELDKNKVFTVKFGKNYLKYGEDFEVDYVNNDAVGTATMRIKGIGEYSGTKNITFRIIGTAFNIKNISIDGLQDSMEYSGKALTQNGVVLKGINGIKSGEELVYRKDYTISYKNNLKKGTATMTFTAKPSSGYTGSFKKTFKINAIGLMATGTAADTVTIMTTASLDDTVKNSTAKDGTADDCIVYTADGIQFAGKVVYTKAGAKISDRICLQNKEGFMLKEGTDYTVSYSANKAVTTDGETAPPVMKIKGKGNYTGELILTFEISKASLEENENLSIASTAVVYNRAKAADYEYRPKVKAADGKQALSDKKDYELIYYNCTQAEVESYLEVLESLEGAPGEKIQAAGLENKRPYAMVTAKEEGNYEGSLKVGLSVYQNKLTGSNLYVVMAEDEAQLTYTGEQVKPEVTVYYGDPKAVKKAKNAKATDENTLLQIYGLKKLALCESEKGDHNVYGDYALTYGANVAAGKNKGSVTVTGTNLYGGSVKVKFTILRKEVYTASK